jgi:hypothetical protein
LVADPSAGLTLPVQPTTATRRSADCRLPIAGCRLPVAGCQDDSAGRGVLVQAPMKACMGIATVVPTRTAMQVRVSQEKT